MKQTEKVTNKKDKKDEKAIVTEDEKAIVAEKKNEYPKFEDWQGIEEYYKRFSDEHEQLSFLEHADLHIFNEKQDLEFRLNPEIYDYQKDRYMEYAGGGLSKQELEEDDTWKKESRYKLNDLRNTSEKIKNTIEYLKNQIEKLNIQPSIIPIRWTKTMTTLVDLINTLDKRGFISCENKGKLVAEHFINNEGKGVTNNNANSSLDNILKINEQGRSKYGKEIDDILKDVSLREEFYNELRKKTPLK